MAALTCCPGCSRHIRRSERQCPFCHIVVTSGASLYLPSERLGRAALFAFAAAGVACSESRREPAPAVSVSPDSSAAPLASVSSGGQIGLNGSLFAAYGSPPAPSGSESESPDRPAPHGAASLGAIAVTGGNVPNAKRVVAGMRAGFRNCYQRALLADPALSGKLIVSIKIGRGGEPLDVQVSAVKGVGETVSSCVERRARAGVFDAPDGVATVTFPVTFAME